MSELSQSEQALLAFEARWPRHTSAKEESIRADLALSPARYYVLLDRLIDTEPALAADPLLVRRVRRLRDGARARRAGRLLDTAG